MSNLDGAVEAVQSMFGLQGDRQLNPAIIEGFPEYVYVSISEREPVIGGPAFVVDISNWHVHKVPGSLPPRLNCQNIRNAV